MTFLGKSLRPHNPINIFSLVYSNTQGNRIYKYIERQKRHIKSEPKCPSCNTTVINTFCNNEYAVCTGAKCKPNPKSPGNYICDCRVVKGCNAAFNGGNCSIVEPYDNIVYSLYSPYLIIKNKLKSKIVQGGFNSAGCLGVKCINHKNGKASCYCIGKQSLSTDNVLLWLSGGQNQLNRIKSGQEIISTAGGKFYSIQQSTLHCFNNNKFIYN